MPHNHNHINKAGKRGYEESEEGEGERKKKLTTSRMSRLIECSCLETGFLKKSEVVFFLSKLQVIPFLFNIFYSLDEGSEKRGYFLECFLDFTAFEVLFMRGFPAVHDISH